MEVLVVVVVLGVIGFFLVLFERIRALERRMAVIAERLRETTERDAPVAAQAPAQRAPAPAPAPAGRPQAAAPAAAAPAPASRPQAPAPAAAVVRTSAPNRPPRPSRWGQAEKSFAHFWTGVLGALALVIGFTFLAILTALRLDAFARFVMLVAISGLLYAASLLVGRRERTRPLASWLKSASGALLLFGCFASSAIPWLRWVDSDLQGYAVLAAGIAVNLFFALAGGQELFASFHTLISLAALAVAPAQALVLIVAAVVAAACSLPAFRKPWGAHLLLCTSSFFAFLVVWMIRQSATSSVIESMAIGCLFLALGPAFVAPYLSHVQTPFGAAARGATWIYLAAGILLFSAHLRWVSGLLLALALAAYLVPRAGRAAGGKPWLARLDSMAGVGLAVLAAFGLTRIDLDPVFVVAVAYAVTALVSADRGADATVKSICGGLQAVLGLAAIGAALASALGSWSETGFFTAGRSQVGIVVGALAAATVVQRRFVPGLPGWFETLLGALYTAFLATLYAIGLDAAPRWAALGGLVFVVGAAAGLTLDWRRPTPSLRNGLMLGAAFCLAASLVANREIGAMAFSDRIGHGVLLVAAAAIALAASWRPWDPRWVSAWPGASLVVIALGSLALSATLRVDRAWTVLLWSAIVTGTKFVLAGVPRPLERPFTIATIVLGLIAATVAAAGGSASPLLRMAAECAVVATLLVWGRKPGGEQRPLPSMSLIAVAMFSLYVYRESMAEAAGTALAVGAIVTMVAGIRGPAWLRCLVPYSVLPYFASLASYAYLTGPAVQEDLVVFSPPWWAGLVAALASLAYVALFYRIADLSTLAIPNEPPWLRGARDGVARFRNMVLFGPYYAALALFFAWCFTGPALTAIYIVTSFTVFALGIALKEPVFRPLAYALLAYCLIRLLFFDMAKAETLDRAFVFIIAGAVLLGMNWLYNRFVDEDTQP